LKKCDGIVTCDVRGRSEQGDQGRFLVHELSPYVVRQ
jgi:hypothetical protein